jgi:hypothetical protein
MYVGYKPHISLHKQESSPIKLQLLVADPQSDAAGIDLPKRFQVIVVLDLALQRTNQTLNTIRQTKALQGLHYKGS